MATIEREKWIQFWWLSELANPDKFIFWMTRNDFYSIHQSIAFANEYKDTLKRKWFESDKKFQSRKKAEFIGALEYKLDQLYYDGLAHKLRYSK